MKLKEIVENLIVVNKKPAENLTLTAWAASTTMLEKKSASAPIILELMEVLAMLIKESRPSSSTGAVKCSEIYLQASLQAKR